MEDSGLCEQNGSGGTESDRPMLSSLSFKDGDNLSTNDAFFYEKFLLDDLDSYWDDLNARLTVSRMVSYAVIKGMVSAVAEETAEKMAAKDDELALLCSQLKCYEHTGVEQAKTLQPLMSSRFRCIPIESSRSSPTSGVELDYSKRLMELKNDLNEHMEELLSNVKANNEGMLSIGESTGSLCRTVDSVFGEVGEMLSSLAAALSDCQWENEFQKEIDSMSIANSFKGLRDEFEAELHVQKIRCNSLGEKWRDNVDALAIVREELNVMLRTVSASEPNPVTSHNSHDGLEERNSLKNKDNTSQTASKSCHPPGSFQPDENGYMLVDEKLDVSKKTMLEVADCAELKSMTKEEALAYYRKEIIKMRRQHDSALQEKTEELFRLKREFLKEKGTSHLRREKEFEILRRKISYVILKLEGVLNENELLSSVVCDDDLEILKERVDAFYFENQRLKGLLARKMEEITCLSTRVADVMAQWVLHLSVEADLLKQNNKLKSDIEDIKVEDAIKDDLCKSIFREFVSKLKLCSGDQEMETEIVWHVYSIIFSSVIDDAMSTTNRIISRHLVETASFEQVLVEKEKELIFKLQENEKLKETIHSLSMFMEEKEKSESVAGSMLSEHIERFDLVCAETDMLRDKLRQQEALFSEARMELDLTKSRFIEALQKNTAYEEERIKLNHNKEQLDLVCEELTMMKDRFINQDALISATKMELDLSRGRLNQSLIENAQYEEENRKLNGEVKDLLNALVEAEKQNGVLHRAIEEKGMVLTKKEKNEKQMDYITISMMEFSKAMAGLENKLSQNVERVDARLSALSHQCTPLMHLAASSRMEELRCKKLLEIRWTNLQKAEAEVDLLADEVDALLGLMGKVCLVLDHYSPILQHYPGVMEVLKLVQRELSGGNTKLK